MSVRSHLANWSLLTIFWLCHLQAAAAQSPEELFQTGQYDAAMDAATAEIARGVWNEKWPRLLMQAQLARGRYVEAIATFDIAIRRYSNSLELRLLVREALLATGDTERAEREADEIIAVLQRPAGRFASADNLVAAGRFLVLRREDARQILQIYYDRVRAAEPRHLEAAIATAELALVKGDFEVASKTLLEVQKLDSGDPRVDYLLFQALAPSDSTNASAALQRALARNPNHVPSLLALVDGAIDSERYDEAASQIDRVLQINFHQPEAWAYLAVIAHLQGEYELERLMRAAALSTWDKNPEVDHLIGRKLSRSYRFAEGAAYQQRALEFDPTHAAANFHLAEDWLRLGNEEVGWKLAHAIAKEDPYNVVAFNLINLYDRMQSFAIIQDEGILVRMEPREAELYGQEVLDCLTNARRVLCEKYQVEPTGPILVEIFTEQKDFAIRTFGLPGGDGFLGVCFGRVITANSPASQGESPSNWRSVLWHEFCHAVTLEKTKNRMPRWLSEGISVYEERQRHPASGESMTPTYREMLLQESLTPVSRLSAAFLNPPSPTHLQFAYFHSSLVVEFLIQRHGFESFLKLLDALAEGLPINDALARTVGSIERLDADFAGHAKKLALAWGERGDWSRKDLPEQMTPDDWVGWNRNHPDHVWGLTRLTESLIEAERDQEAIEPLQNLVRLGVITGKRGGTLDLLAKVYGGLQLRDAEQQTLMQMIELTDDALPALNRLAVFAREQEDWDSLAKLSQQILDIQPLTSFGHEHLAIALERLGMYEEAIRPLKALTLCQPADPASIDYRLAFAHHSVGKFEESKRHIVAALQEAPRYRNALRLLLKLTETKGDQ